jgi:DNA-binding GntR family transcriptional regulator
MFSSLTIDGRSKFSPSEQIYYYVIDEILGLNIDANTIFPLCTELAMPLKVSVTVVEQAYARLVKEKYCEYHGTRLGLMEAELRRSIQIRSIGDLLAIATRMNMTPVTIYDTPIVKRLPQDVLQLSKQTMPKRSLVTTSLNLGDDIPLSFVYEVINQKKLPENTDLLSGEVSMYSQLSARSDAIVQPTLMSATRLSETVAMLLHVPNQIPAICMHSSIDIAAQKDVAQLYVFVTPRVFLTLKS